jgi:hypothetical protein
MAITEQTPINVSIATAGATVFPYDFKILDQAHLRVEVNSTAKVVGVDFNVTGVGLNGGGNITFTAPLAGTEVVMRKRNMPYDRLTDYQNLGDLRAPTLNNDQDAPVMMMQQIVALLGRFLSGPATVIDNSWNFNATNRNIVNLADGVNPQDAVNLRQMINSAVINNAIIAASAPKIVSAIVAGVITPAGDTDLVRPAMLTAALTIANPSTTPFDGGGFVVDLIDNATPRALTWGSQYASRMATLPATTIAGKRHRIGFEFSLADNKLYCMYADRQP